MGRKESLAVGRRSRRWSASSSGCWIASSAPMLPQIVTRLEGRALKSKMTTGP
jgi:hypothetical protein